MKFAAFIIFLGALAGSVLYYIGGRILAPELGLDVPSYWAWFWFCLIVQVPAAIINTVSKELTT